MASRATRASAGQRSGVTATVTSAPETVGVTPSCSSIRAAAASGVIFNLWSSGGGPRGDARARLLEIPDLLLEVGEPAHEGVGRRRTSRGGDGDRRHAIHALHDVG